jgi:hypothetical protein
MVDRMTVSSGSDVVDDMCVALTAAVANVDLGGGCGGDSSGGAPAISPLPTSLRPICAIQPPDDPDLVECPWDTLPDQIMIEIIAILSLEDQFRAGVTVCHRVSPCVTVCHRVSPCVIAYYHVTDNSRRVSMFSLALAFVTSARCKNYESEQ